MPRRRQYVAVSGYHLAKIERQASLLAVALDEATRSLEPFCQDYDAIGQPQVDIRRALNILNGRPADYARSHGAMSEG